MIQTLSLPSSRPGSLGWIKAMTRDMTGHRVTSVRAPGATGRRSMRLGLDDGRTLIATRYATMTRARQEGAILAALSGEGAPVPAVVGCRDGLLLQGDVGQARLSTALAEADEAGRARLARSAVAALETCRAAIDRRPDLQANLPALGTRAGWLEGFVARIVFLSNDLGIAPPQVDLDAVTAALAHPPVRFTRWGARLDSAVVGPDGRVTWCDWDQFGLRAGVEDIAWLIADEHWSLPQDTTESLLQELTPDPNLRHLARRMAVLIAINWLAAARQAVLSGGWIEADARRSPDLAMPQPPDVSRLCARMAALCADDTVLGGLSPWFVQVGAEMTAVLARPECSGQRYCGNVPDICPG